MGMGNLQRMAQQMQQEMLRVQTELEATTVDGSAGGGVVKATVTGKQELVSVTIDPSAVDPDDVEMLQDLSSRRSTTRSARRASWPSRRWPPSPAACASRACRPRAAWPPRSSSPSRG